MSLLRQLAQHAQSRPNHPALTYLDATGTPFSQLSWSEWAHATAVLTAQLQRQFPSGSAVVLVVDPEPRFAVAFLACLAAGLVSLPLPPMDPLRAAIQTKALRDCAQDSSATHILCAGESAQLLASQELHGLIPFVLPEVSDLLAQPAVDLNDAPLPQLTTLLYTSGSTSAPKGVPIPHSALLYNGLTCAETWAIQPASVLVSWMPNQHSFGLCFNLLLPLASGCHVVAMAPSTFIGNPRLWFQALHRYRGTHSAAATFGYQLCIDRLNPTELTQLDLSTWTVGLISAEPVRQGVCLRFLETFKHLRLPDTLFCALYGLSECGPITSMPVHVPSRFHHRTGTPPELALACVGHPFSGSVVRIVDADGQPVPEGVVGEVWLTGPSMLQGYHGHPTHDPACFTQIPEHATPFFRTGDQGFVDAHGLTITGRIKELLIVRGKNIVPQEIEWAACSGHPALTGRTAAAFEASCGTSTLVLEVGPDVPASDHPALIHAAAAAVAHQLGISIDRWILTEPGAIPKTASGKIRRGPCRAALEAGTLPCLFQHSSARAEASAPTPPAASHDLLDQLRQLFSAELGLDPNDLDADTPLSAFAIDSASVMALTGALSALAGKPIHPTAFYRNETLSEWVASIEDQRG